MSGMITRASVRAFTTEALRVVNNVAMQQFIVSLQNDNAVLSYRLVGKNITFDHTDVPPVFQGKGVGKLLAESPSDISELWRWSQISEQRLYFQGDKVHGQIFVTTSTAPIYLMATVPIKLVYAFDHAKSNKLDVICKCHFLAKYYEKNLSRYKGLKVKIELE